ncbi:alpha-glucosidase [Promicromonospora umidemergens]|uniref:CBM6 domain-containing protein n=1 Tax=Promicromonospora umidemergens TaxID=629679 RepID=A0ABP8XRB6_9MICO|nr:glycoside hydrolase family 97 catalytic domain-containing protein [Promicromonospora umidemergens]MCP2281816.1 alpha-glucosidase [Promicromonospora umidemergens]
MIRRTRAHTDGPRVRRGRGSALTAAATAVVLLVPAAVTGGSPAHAQEPAAALDGYQVASPDRSIEVGVEAVDGTLTYEVVRDGRTTVLEPSGLGFRLREPALDLTTGLTITSVERSVVDETWTPAWGDDARIRNHANELTVHAEHQASGVELDVVFRVFDDGVGFRYHFPGQDALGDDVVVADETTEFALPTDLAAYSIPAGTAQNADERHYRTQPLPDVASAQTPITLSRTPDDLFLAVHEADLTDFPSMTLRGQGAPGTLVADLIALPNGDKAVIDVGADGFSTPWRTVTVGRSAGALAESHLVENLNDPCALCDVDGDGDGTADTTGWIDPGTYVGVWWELQRRHTTWDAGPRHGATTERIKEYVDLAVEAGAKYVLAEGWNENAGGSWTNQDFVTPQADVDLDEVLAYAAENGVGFMAHNETRGYVDYYDEHMDEIFAQYEEWGIHAIKTGYATRFELGGVGRSHYDQEAVQHYQRVIETAARHKITINAHESIKPTGLSRTYPNMMTGEGVAGMEQHNYKGANGNPPEQATILPFTRWIGGPADYTPGVLAVTWDPADLGTRVQSTTTNQLALYPTFSSPLQMLADTPENYAEHAEAFAYLKDMPTRWDESHVLDAAIGDHIVTARRNGSTWYLGSITDEQNRTVRVPLTFLDRRTTYVADIYSDAADTSWKGNPTAVEVTHALVDSADTLEASMVGAGGQAVKLRKATAADLEELPDYAASSFALDGTPEVSYDPVADTVTVTVTVRNDGTTVGQAAVAVDGDVVPEATARIGGGRTGTSTFDMPADAVPYRGANELSVVDADGNSGGSTTAELLPRPDGQLLDLLERQTRHLAPARAALLVEHAEQALAAAEEGDFPATRRAMQAIRHVTLTSSADDVPVEPATEIEGAVEPFLGEAAGLFGILSLVRDAERAGAVDEAVAAALREPAAAAATHARTGDSAALAAALQDLASRIETAEGDEETLATLLAAVEAQSAEHVGEAEAGALVGGARTTTEHPGYTGTGFVRDLTRAGAGVRFTYEAAVPTTVELSFRYANGMVVAPLDRQLSVSVDGGAARQVAFPNLGQDADRWRRWAYSPGLPMTLEPGRHEILLHHAAGDTGHVNLDHLRVTATPGVLPNGKVEAWAAGTAYTAGDLVSFDGSLWDASWWTRDQAPGGSADGPWQEITETFDGTAVWTPSRIFDDGDFVLHDGALYEARWWTRHQEPGGADGPWRPVG